MGSSSSSPRAPDPVLPPPEATTAPANPMPADTAEAPTSPAPAALFNNCWSCRILSGSGLIAAGAYVYLVARRPMKLGLAPGPGPIAQMVVGISIACWGVVILVDPKGKAYRVA
ncbi:distal membrane-arm assembly complex protein 1 [Perognathus longimembris pacificus]|uniref:distal membrane-arm assembly complex protein 1 n=1 Tax=Perognathus longimembris pacificus TaxID=214514 RepID=UPI002019B332|nr:distal membrane-arm assembly complex protein 1 [Perognathus longimembris pacificus]